MKRLTSVLILFAFVAAAAVPAPAQTDVSAAKAAKTGLLGGTVQLEYLYMDDTESTQYTILRKAPIDSQVEYDDAQLHFGKGQPWRFCVTMDVADHTIRISDIYLLWNGEETHNGRIAPTRFNGFVLTFRNTQPITAVTINPESTLNLAGDGEEPSFDAKAIGFSSNQITINWSNAKIDEKTVISLDVATSPEKAPRPRN
jgi:hypothetical protein